MLDTHLELSRCTLVQEFGVGQIGWETKLRDGSLTYAPVEIGAAFSAGELAWEKRETGVNTLPAEHAIPNQAMPRHVEAVFAQALFFRAL
jgi:hypothetical protein